MMTGWRRSATLEGKMIDSISVTYQNSAGQEFTRRFFPPYTAWHFRGYQNVVSFVIDGKVPADVQREIDVYEV